AWVVRSIRAAALSLEARNRELDAFAGRVAHDLRGPLTTIKLAAGTSDACRRGVARMEALINDLLTLSRAGGEGLGVVSDVSSVAAAVAEALGANVKAVDGILRIAVAPARVCCSESLIRQALGNLVENAIKYRRPDVRLELAIRGRPAGRDYEL